MPCVVLVIAMFKKEKADKDSASDATNRLAAAADQEIPKDEENPVAKKEGDDKEQKSPSEDDSD